MTLEISLELRRAACAPRRRYDFIAPSRRRVADFMTLEISLELRRGACAPQKMTNFSLFDLT